MTDIFWPRDPKESLPGLSHRTWLVLCTLYKSYFQESIESDKDKFVLGNLDEPFCMNIEDLKYFFQPNEIDTDLSSLLEWIEFHPLFDSREFDVAVLGFKTTLQMFDS